MTIASEKIRVSESTEKTLLSTKYLFMVICPSKRTYNHLTYFEENKSMRSKPKDTVLVFHVFTPKLSCMSRFCGPYV